MPLPPRTPRAARGVISSRGAFATRLIAAHRVETFGDRRYLKAERSGSEAFQLRERVGRLLRARIEVTADPRLHGAQVLAVAGFVARQERHARIQQSQAQILAHEVSLRRWQERR